MWLWTVVEKENKKICKGSNEIGEKKKTSFSTCTNQAIKILKHSPSPEHTFCDNEFTDVQTYQLASYGEALTSK